MLTTKDQFEKELKKLISEAYQNARDNIAHGSAMTFDEYKKQVGMIQGLAYALELIEEANNIVNSQR
jgi:5-methylcytosine-specific restriction endonuclease McrBC GTP-binding regulatory subunit McrB